MADGIRSFRDLEIWQVSMDLAVSIHKATQKFPKEELYSLSDQMRRSAGSVPSNIAEGAGRVGPTEFKHFISIALGSLAELCTWIEIARRLEYLTEEAAATFDREVTRTESMAWKLRKSLR